MSDQVSNKLERIQAELGEIVDERIQALEAVLQNAERMTRRLIKAEMELEHLSGNETELTLQASTLEDQVAAARSRNAEIEATHQRLLAERDFVPVDWRGHVDALRSAGAPRGTRRAQREPLPPPLVALLCAAGRTRHRA